MIEEIVTTYLNNKLTVPVHMGAKPTNKPSEYVTLEVLDAGRFDYVDAVTFNIRSYSSSPYKAAVLNEAVKKAMFDIIELPSIASSKLGGGGQAPETLTKEYAYECVFNIRYYAEV